MRLAKRDIKLLLVLLGIVIFVGSYFWVYSDYMDRTETLSSEADGLAEKLTQLRETYGSLYTYELGIEDAAAAIEREKGRYSAEIRDDDWTMYAVELESAVGIDVSSLSISAPSLLYTISGGEADGETPEEEPAEGSVAAWKETMSIRCSLTYGELKQLLDYIAGSDKRTTVESVSVSYDSETAELVGDVIVGKYFLTGAGLSYQEQVIPAVTYGNKNFFATVQTAGTASAG